MAIEILAIRFKALFWSALSARGPLSAAIAGHLLRAKRYPNRLIHYEIKLVTTTRSQLIGTRASRARLRAAGRPAEGMHRAHTKRAHKTFGEGNKNSNEGEHIDARR